ncbi:hypothetical protein ACFPK1_12525 [Actinomycetospora rhizophila]|uniref:Uncharacterized protein n=1 Tax=Actinomycetospora rhizophila TaxID=1416876 RepID=A0ABV9ZF94_9PSEU
MNEYNVLVADTATNIHDELDRTGDSALESLQLALAEPMLTALAAKATVGIASSFAGRILYDRWKLLREKEDVDQLGDEVLAGEHFEGDPELVGQAKVDVVDLLTAHGLTGEQAERVTSRLVETMRMNVGDLEH